MFEEFGMDAKMGGEAFPGRVLGEVGVGGEGGLGRIWQGALALLLSPLDVDIGLAEPLFSIFSVSLIFNYYFCFVCLSEYVGGTTLNMGGKERKKVERKTLYDYALMCGPWLNLS